MGIRKVIRYLGHGVALAWAGFWLAAGAHTGLVEGQSLSQAVTYTLIPGGLCLLLVAVTWRWERVGAWAVLLCGLALVGHSSIQPAVTGPMLLLAGPPLLGGVLLVIYGRLGPATTN